MLDLETAGLGPGRAVLAWWYLGGRYVDVRIEANSTARANNPTHTRQGLPPPEVGTACAGCFGASFSQNAYRCKVSEPAIAARTQDFQINPPLGE
jgi:hypothetical protein